MDTLGIDATPEEIDLMVTEIDQDSNGEIDFDGERTGGAQRATLFSSVSTVDNFLSLLC